MKYRHFLRLAFCVSLSSGAVRAETLTMDEAVSRVLRSHPSVQAADSRVSAADSLYKQSRNYQNPSLETEVENIGGSGDHSGMDAAEITVAIHQPISLGGKRQAEQKRAEAEVNLAGKEYEEVRQALVTSTRQTFITVFAHQERLVLLDDRISDLENVVAAAERRRTSGAGSSLELARAEIEYAQAVSDRGHMQIQLQGARRHLALLLGRSVSDLPRLSLDFYAIDALPPLEQVLPRLRNNPEWLKWNDQRQVRTAALEAAKSKSIPDLDLGLGWRRDEAEGAESFLFSIGLPLPLFDRNQAASEAEQQMLDALEQEQAAANVEMENRLTKAWSSLQQAVLLADSIEKSVLPAAEKAWSEAERGWNQGRFGYLDLIDVQHLLTESRQQHIDAVEKAHHSKAQVEALIAGPLHLSKTPKQD